MKAHASDASRIDTIRRTFLEHVEARSIAGGHEHQERSFDVPGNQLAGEITEELADVCGWAIVLYGRVQRLEALLERVEQTESFLTDLAAAVGPDGKRGHGSPHSVVELAHLGLKELSR